jgi:flagellum-specific ATP synthase
MPDLASREQMALASETVQLLALLERNHQMVELGAYERGTNPQLDAALALKDRLAQWFRQSDGGVSRAQALAQLEEIVKAQGAKA